MARRLTAAQQIEGTNEEIAQVFFEETLASLPDPRRKQGLRYPLRTVVVTGLMAMVCGCDDAEAMEAWGRVNEDWLATFLELPHGAPSQDVFLSVFGALDPEKFSAVFRSWASLLTLRLGTTDKHIAIDGKTSRRSFDRQQDKKAIHTVSAYLSAAGLVLGQKRTGEKSNEIKAIPELLRVLDLSGSTVTIDAMGCQTEIAATIVDGGGNYLLGVKGNQPKLHKDIEAVFAQVDVDKDALLAAGDPEAMETFVEVDKGHGRHEKRTITLCRDLSQITTAEKWAGLAFVAKVERQRSDLSTDETSTETAYYVGSDAKITPKEAAHAIRRHWGIENQLHWVLDIAFNEDTLRHRARNVAQNMTVLRHFALNLIRLAPDRKLGIANTRKRAGWDRSFLIRLCTTVEA